MTRHTSTHTQTQTADTQVCIDNDTCSTPQKMNIQKITEYIYIQLTKLASIYMREDMNTLDSPVD